MNAGDQMFGMRGKRRTRPVALRRASRRASRGCAYVGGSGALSHSARNAHVQNSYSSPSLFRTFNDLLVAVLLLDFVPESRDLAAAISRMLNDVMEGDNPACPDKRGISEKVLFHSFIGVITINKKNVQGLSDALDLGDDLV